MLDFFSAMPVINVARSLDLESGYTMVGYAEPPAIKLSTYPGAVWLGRARNFKFDQACRYCCKVGNIWRQYRGDHYYCDHPLSSAYSAMLALGNPGFIIIIKS